MHSGFNAGLVYFCGGEQRGSWFKSSSDVHSKSGAALFQKLPAQPRHMFVKKQTLLDAYEADTWTDIKRTEVGSRSYGAFNAAITLHGT